MSHFLQNLNGHLLCAIDTETTGHSPGFHDMIEVAIIPLNYDLKPDNNILPYCVDLMPLRPQNAAEDAMRVNKRKITELMVKGMDPFLAADRFMEWFENLKLGYNKRIMPLGCNWPFDRAFIMEWLGPLTYNLIFDSQYRDIQVAGTFMNDMDGWRGRDFSYPKLNLSYLCTQLDVQRYRLHSAVDDARVTAECYRKMIQLFVPG